MGGFTVTEGVATMASGGPAAWLEEFWVRLRRSPEFATFAEHNPVEVSRLMDVVRGGHQDMETAFGQALAAVAYAQRSIANGNYVVRGGN